MAEFQCKKPNCYFSKSKVWATLENMKYHYLGHPRDCLVHLAKENGVINPYFETKDILAKELAMRSRIQCQ